MDTKKDALLDSMKPILPQTLSAVRLLERCIVDTEKGTLQSEIAVDTARVLVGLHQQIVAAVESVGLDSDKSTDGQKIMEFIQGEFKRTILLLGEALKLALQSNNAGGLSQHAQDFRNHPRTLVNMIRNANLTVDSKDNKTSKPKVPAAGIRATGAPKRPIARSLSDGKMSRVDDPDALLEDFRLEAKSRKEGISTSNINKEDNKELLIKPKENDKVPKAHKEIKEREHNLEKKQSSRKKGNRSKKRGENQENSRRDEFNRRTEDTRREDGKIEENDEKKEKKKSSRIPSSESKSTLNEEEKSKARKQSSKRKNTESINEKTVEKSSSGHSKKSSNSSKHSGVSTKSSTRRPRPPKEDRDARKEKRKSMPTPAKLDLDDLDNKRRRTKVVDPSVYIGFDTDPGKRYGKINQDAYLYSHTGKHGHITAVFDGHGVNGEIAAQTAKETFETYFKKHDLFGTKSKEKQKEMIREVFLLAHENIIKKYEELTTIKWEGHKFNLVQVKDLMMYQNKKYGVLLQDFGTTAVMAAIRSQPIGEGTLEVIVANAGDSIAFIGREDGDSLIPIEGLCTVHNGNNVVEEDRILSLGSVKKEGHYVSPPEESGFGWAQLAVTRSLGHKYFSKYGIIPDPDISDYTIDENDRFLIVTSDGVTDVFSLEEILESLEEYYHACGGNLQKTTTKLVKYSVGMWKKRFVDSRGKGEAADNTTAMVIDLKKIVST